MLVRIPLFCPDASKRDVHQLSVLHVRSFGPWNLIITTPFDKPPCEAPICTWAISRKSYFRRETLANFGCPENFVTTTPYLNHTPQKCTSPDIGRKLSANFEQFAKGCSAQPKVHLANLHQFHKHGRARQEEPGSEKPCALHPVQLTC